MPVGLADLELTDALWELQCKVGWVGWGGVGAMHGRGLGWVNSRTQCMPFALHYNDNDLLLVCYKLLEVQVS